MLIVKRSEIFSCSYQLIRRFGKKNFLEFISIYEMVVFIA